MNLASTISQTSFISQYRKAGLLPIAFAVSESSPLLRKTVMDCPLFWTLARKYNTWLKDGLLDKDGKTPIPVQDFMVMSSFRKEEEAFAKQVLPLVGVMTERARSLSNLGVFDGDVGKEDGEEGEWGIGNVEFSVAATKPCVGNILYFGIVSLRGGDCVIHVTYNEGVLEDELVSRLLKSMELRLGYLVEGS